jgi:hypothetical protein
MRSPFASLVFGALLTAAAAASVAQDTVPPPAAAPLPPQFEVEVIVFANRAFDPTEERFEAELSAFDGGLTTLREPPVFDDTSLSSALPPPTGVPEPVDPLEAERAEALRIRPLEPEALKLVNEYRRLRALAAYTPLVHTGWVQPGLPEEEAEPFDLAMLGTVNPSGTVRVHLSRLNRLHITVDVTYRPDATATPAVAANDSLGELVLPTRYHLAATRIARSGELHYFDHPAFGVLVRITPVPRPDAQGRQPAA